MEKRTFPKKVSDRNMIADLLKDRLPWARVVSGAPGCPFISIERDIDNPKRTLMWDTTDFKYPTVLKQIRRPNCTWAGQVIFVFRGIDYYLVKKKMYLILANRLAEIAECWLKDED